MIDVEEEMFDELARAVLESYPDAYVSGEAHEVSRLCAYR